MLWNLSSTSKKACHLLLQCLKWKKRRLLFIGNIEGKFFGSFYLLNMGNCLEESQERSLLGFPKDQFGMAGLGTTTFPNWSWFLVKFSGPEKEKLGLKEWIARITNAQKRRKKACIMALPLCGSYKENKCERTTYEINKWFYQKIFKNSKELQLLYYARIRGIIVK